MSIEGYEDVPLIYDNTSGTSKVAVDIIDHTMEPVGVCKLFYGGNIINLTY